MEFVSGVIKGYYLQDIYKNVIILVNIVTVKVIKIITIALDALLIIIGKKIMNIIAITKTSKC